MDEKVDNSGWRIKIVADCGYTHQIVGQKWVPGGALLSRGRVWPVDVPETSCKSMPTLRMGRGSVIMSSGLDWERFGVITGGDEVFILPPPTLSEKGVGIPIVYFPKKILYVFLAIMHTKNLYENGPNPYFFSGPKT